MLDLLKILLCGMGVVYLAARFGRLLLATQRGYPLWPPADTPMGDADATAHGARMNVSRRTLECAGAERNRAKHPDRPCLARFRP